MISQKVAKWLDGIISAGVSGAVNGIAAIVVDPVNFNLQEGFSKVVSLAAAGAFIGVIMYLRQSPLPTDLSVLNLVNTKPQKTESEAK